MSLVDATLSAFLQAAILGGVPFLGYVIYHKRRHKRTFGEIARRAGLQLGERRYIVYSLVFALAGTLALVIWSPPVEVFTRQGSAQRQFVGLGFGMRAITWRSSMAWCRLDSLKSWCFAASLPAVWRAGFRSSGRTCRKPASFFCRMC